MHKFNLFLWVLIIWGLRALVVLICWNSICPSVSGLSSITYGQAYALSVLITVFKLPVNYNNGHERIEF